MPSLTRRSFLRSGLIIAAALKFPLPHARPREDYSITLFNPEGKEVVCLPWRKHDVGWVDRGTHSAVYNIKTIGFRPIEQCLVQRWKVNVLQRSVTGEFDWPKHLLPGDILQFPAGCIEIIDA